jgi:hypothetical protein
MRRHNPVLQALEYPTLDSGGFRWKKDLKRRLDAEPCKHGVALVAAE